MKFGLSIPTVLFMLVVAGDGGLASPSESDLPRTLLQAFAAEKQSTPLAAVPDAINFIRALRTLLVTDTHALDSELLFTGSAAGFSFRSDVRIQTVLEQPNRFRSLIQFVEPGSTANEQYIVTSNGQQVWIYDAAQNIYSVMPYGEFIDNYDSSFLIGIFTTFWLGVLEDTAEDVRLFTSISEEDLLQNEALLRQIEADLDIENSTIGTETVDGVQYTTFSYADPQDDFTMTLFIDPTTALIEDIHLTGQVEELEIVMQEAVTHKASGSPPAADAFTFLPPTGAQRSETPIPIGAF